MDGWGESADVGGGVMVVMAFSSAFFLFVSLAFWAFSALLFIPAFVLGIVHKLVSI